MEWPCRGSSIRQYNLIGGDSRRWSAGVSKPAIVTAAPDFLTYLVAFVVLIVAARCGTLWRENCVFGDAVTSGGFLCRSGVEDRAGVGAICEPLARSVAGVFFPAGVYEELGTRATSTRERYGDANRSNRGFRTCPARIPFRRSESQAPNTNDSRRLSPACASGS